MATKRKSERARPAAHRRRERSDDGNAFIPDPGDGPARAPDDLSERLAEEYVAAATSGEEPDEERDANVPEDIGGPFVETSANEELADDTDETNPADATREPLPRAIAADAIPGRTVEELNDPDRHRRQH
jgi:hypothetical protein